ncbi:hypothetical protein TNCV_4818941 [Trichonephila clavipes]|nr:hypothetical protein TNCV_4818941 [Trichonephila clavipes]
MWTPQQKVQFRQRNFDESRLYNDMFKQNRLSVLRHQNLSTNDSCTCHPASMGVMTLGFYSSGLGTNPEEGMDVSLEKEVGL